MFKVAGRPAQVIIEFVTAGEEGLQIDEVLQAAFAVQIVKEAEAAFRVTWRDQIFQERDLHMGVVQQHMRVPGKAGLALNEQGILRLPCLTMFVERKGQGNVGGAEADADQVMNMHKGPRG